MHPTVISKNYSSSGLLTVLINFDKKLIQNLNADLQNVEDRQTEIQTDWQTDWHHRSISRKCFAIPSPPKNSPWSSRLHTPLSTFQKCLDPPMCHVLGKTHDAIMIYLHWVVIMIYLHCVVMQLLCNKMPTSLLSVTLVPCDAARHANNKYHVMQIINIPSVSNHAREN